MTFSTKWINEYQSQPDAFKIDKIWTKGLCPQNGQGWIKKIGQHFAQ